MNKKKKRNVQRIYADHLCVQVSVCVCFSKGWPMNCFWFGWPVWPGWLPDRPGAVSSGICRPTEIQF